MSHVPSEWIERFAELLGSGGVLTERSDLERFETGWRYGHGRAALVVRPTTTEEVRSVVELANELDLRLHAAGANTGLVGASNPDASGEQVVVSLERLNQRIDVDPADRTVTVDAGVRLSSLNQALAAHDLELPIDLGADPQVGGMVATNTGGARLLRHGDVRRHLLGLEVVLADGSVLSRLAPLRKDNTGFDWKQLFVGTGGRFGIVTRATLSVDPRPRQSASAIVATRDGEALLGLLAFLEPRSDGTLSAFEAISREALEVTLRHGSDVVDPFPGEAPGYAGLVELSSRLEPDRLDLSQLLEENLAEYVESDAGEGVEDVRLGRAEDFWSLRHQVSECLAREGSVLALDLSVPRPRLAEFTARARALVAERFPGARTCDFGHWGDGGTHLNVLYDPAGVGAPEAEFKRAVQGAIYDLCVRSFGGSFSAEHGLGPHNREHARRLLAPRRLELERGLTRLLDPSGRWARSDDA